MKDEKILSNEELMEITAGLNSITDSTIINVPILKYGIIPTKPVLKYGIRPGNSGIRLLYAVSPTYTTK